MAVSTRFLLACAVVGVLGASSMTLYILPGDAQSTTPARPTTEAVQPAALATGPPVTGARIVEIAAGPASKRAKALAEQAKPAAPTEEADPGRAELSRQIREACDEGVLRGRACRR